MRMLRKAGLHWLALGYKSRKLDRRPDRGVLGPAEKASGESMQARQGRSVLALLTAAAKRFIVAGSVLQHPSHRCPWS